MKSSIEKIRQRFDADVDRFSDLSTGQTATVDAALCMGLVVEAASLVTPAARDLLDIGCGAGNYTLRMLQRLPGLHCVMVDLSAKMLERAGERVRAAGAPEVTLVQEDMRNAKFGKRTFDIVLAAAALHHLRTQEEWEGMFRKIYAALRPGGSFWVFDLVEQETAGVQRMMQKRYGDYLSGLKGGGQAGAEYARKVFEYVEEEDTPRSLGYQLRLLAKVGFVEVDVLHKNVLFAAFGGVRRSEHSKS